MSFSSLVFVPWLLLSLVIIGLNITSAVLLLREKHAGTWLMLAGGGVSLLGTLVHFVVQMMMVLQPQRMMVELAIKWLTPAGALASLGSLVFAIGLLMHALRERGKASRIAELEAILQSRQG